jgi:hypothetical protein
MNVKPLLLGVVAAALVTTAIVKTTSESDKITFAPAPFVETIPAPPVVKSTPAEDDAYLRGVKDATNAALCPVPAALPPVRPVFKPVAKHLVKAKHPAVPAH